MSSTALFVSVCALFILVYQTHLSNKMYYLEDKALKASAMPILEIVTSSGTGYFRLEVRNVGIGPVRVKEVYVRYRDSVYTEDMCGAIMDYINPMLEQNKQVLNFAFGNISGGMVIPINGAITHVAAGDNIAAANLKDIFFGKQQSNTPMPVNMAIVYTSIYEEEEWTAYLFDSFETCPGSD